MPARINRLSVAQSRADAEYWLQLRRDLKLTRETKFPASKSREKGCCESCSDTTTNCLRACTCSCNGSIDFGCPSCSGNNAEQCIQVCSIPLAIIGFDSRYCTAGSIWKRKIVDFRNSHDGLRSQRYWKCNCML